MTTKSRTLYLDAAATRPMVQSAVDVMNGYLLDPISGGPDYGNPSSPGRHGQRARVHLERARRTVASLLEAHATHITFTSGATEANNLALWGAYWAHLNTRSSTPFTVLTGSTEHASIRQPLDALRRLGARILTVPALLDGFPDLAVLDQWLQSIDEIHLASFIWVNNETGVITPIHELAERFHTKQIPFHVDAVQAASTQALSALHHRGITSAAFSAHKVGGPMGSGFLWHQEPNRLRPMFYGGGQEADRRAGTEAVMLHMASAEAFRNAQTERESFVDVCTQNRALLTEALDRERLAYVIHGNASECTSSILSVAFPGLDAQSLIIALDMNHIEVSAGSACSSGATEPSQVLRAMSVPDALIQSTLRISFWEALTHDDCSRIASVLRQFRERHVH